MSSGDAPVVVSKRLGLGVAGDPDGALLHREHRSGAPAPSSLSLISATADAHGVARSMPKRFGLICVPRWLRSRIRATDAGCGINS